MAIVDVQSAENNHDLSLLPPFRRQLHFVLSASHLDVLISSCSLLGIFLSTVSSPKERLCKFLAFSSRKSCLSTYLNHRQHLGGRSRLQHSPTPASCFTLRMFDNPPPSPYFSSVSNCATTFSFRFQFRKYSLISNNGRL